MRRIHEENVAQINDARVSQLYRLFSDHGIISA